MILLGLAVYLAVFRAALEGRVEHGGQSTVELFRIAGSLHYVFTQNVTSCMLTGPEGPA